MSACSGDGSRRGKPGTVQRSARKRGARPRFLSALTILAVGLGGGRVEADGPVSLRLPAYRGIDADSMPEVMQRTHDAARALDRAAGRPNGERAVKNGIEYLGTILFTSDAVGWHDVPSGELDTSSSGDLCRSAYEWCRRNGYAGGYPNFHKRRDAGGVMRYGVVGVKAEFAERRDVRVEGVPRGDYDALFRKIHRWARDNGYVTGFPNMHRKPAPGDAGDYGAILLKAGACRLMDVPTEPPRWSIDGMPSVKQPDDISCGPASCAIVLGRYGISAGIGPLKTKAGTRKLGDIVGWTHPDGMVDALRSYGLSCRKHEDASLEDLRRVVSRNRPAILLLRSGPAYWHWVVAYGFDRSADVVLVSDPGDGRTHALPVKVVEGSWRFSHDLAGTYIPDPECTVCRGSGKQWTECAMCGATGRLSALGGWTKCPSCSGRGRWSVACIPCGGDGRQTDVFRKLVESSGAKGHTMIVPDGPVPSN